MHNKYNIDDICYTIIGNKIRPVKIAGIEIKRASVTYNIEIINDDGDITNAIRTENVLYLRPADVAFWIMQEWEQWDANQKELEK